MAEQKVNLPASVERVDVVVDTELPQEVVGGKGSADSGLIRGPEQDSGVGVSPAAASKGDGTFSVPLAFGALSARDLDQTEHRMAEYDGKVKLITNVASLCKTTDTNYDELMQLYDRLLPDGLEILGFPCQQFKGQEYSTPEEIKEFISNYNVSFPVFDLTIVNGPEMHPVFVYCKWHSEELYGDGRLKDIEWNFGKFLLDRNNRVYKYYKHDVNPLQMADDVRKLLSGELKGRIRGPDGKFSDASTHTGRRTDYMP